MVSKPVLYSYYRSSCAWRVRFAMALKGIEYELKPVDLKADGNIADWYKKINPMAQVPALAIDGHMLVQSLSILEYLEETRPEPSLFANNDPFTRAQVREICQCVNSGIQPLQQQNTPICQAMGDETKQVEFIQQVMTKGFEAIEKLLSKTASKFCVGDTVSLADCYLAPQIYNANRYNVDMTRFPIIQRVNASIQGLKEYQVTHPSAQPDCRSD